MECLNCRNFVTAQAFLTGWYLLTFFTVAPFLCTLSVILDFCIILAASNTVIWVSLFGTHRFKLEVKGFIFHVVVFSKETFQTLAWKFLLYMNLKEIELRRYNHYKVLNTHSVNGMQSLQGVKDTECE